MEKRPLIRVLKPALRVSVLLLIILGAVYPLVLVVMGQAVFPYQSNGSLASLDSKPVGSALIAQQLTSPMFFHTRAPLESGSGVDPDIAPMMAYLQAPDVSMATGISVLSLNALITDQVSANAARNLYVFAPPYVNVLELNLALISNFPSIYANFTQ
ncbi:MAG: potassium-transporting ATPase subunit C [Thaumarchaeota archaeon]|nr:potassium-transporting ATPase subunit C [Nitrososphaerota archaeon]